MSGVLLLGESFNFNKLVGFVGIWIGLAIFSYNLVMCVVSRKVIVDKQALLLKSGEKGTMTRETQTLVCDHPTERDRAVVLNYLHRYQPGNRDPEFIDKARQVFESIAFKTRN
jgi:hypothetical protein